MLKRQSSKGIFAFGLERIGLIGIARPMSTVFMLIMVSAAMIYGATQTSFDDDLRRLFRSDRGIYLAHARLIEQFPAVENQLVLLVESDKPLTKPQLETIRMLHLDVQFVDGVAGVVSIFSARSPPDKSGTARLILPAELPGGPQLNTLLTQVYEHPLITGKILSKNMKTTVVSIMVKSGIRKFENISRLLSDIEQLVKPARDATELRITMTGGPALRHDILRSINQDFHILNLLGSILAISICILFFRKPALVFIASLPPLISVVWTLGMFGLVGQPVTAINNILPTLVLVIAFSDALHMVQAIRRKLAFGATTLAATRETVYEIGPACAMTSVTTIIACLSLTFSESATVQEFGLAGAIAIMAAYFAVIVIVPTLSVLLLRPKVHKYDQTGAGWFNSLIGAASSNVWPVVSSHGRIIAVVSVLMLVATGWLYIVTGTSYDYREYLSSNSPASQAIDRINLKLGGADVLHVLIEQKSGSEEENPDQAGEAVAAVHQMLQDRDDFTNVFSITSTRDWIAGQNGKQQKHVQTFMNSLPDHYRARIVSSSRKAWLVTAYFPATPAPETRMRLDQLAEDFATLRKRYPGYAIEPTGIVALGAYASEFLITGLKHSLTGAVVITMAVIAVTAGSLSLALLSAVPNLLALTIIAAFLYAFGSGFQITAVLAMTIAFGIAVDNTIHFLNRFKLARAGSSIAGALEESCVKVGPVLIAATLVLSCGLAVTQLSSLPMVQLFGQLSIIVIGAALIATLFILPAMIAVTHRDR